MIETGPGLTSHTCTENTTKSENSTNLAKEAKPTAGRRSVILPSRTQKWTLANFRISSRTKFEFWKICPLMNDKFLQRRGFINKATLYSSTRKVSDPFVIQQEGGNKNFNDHWSGITLGGKKKRWTITLTRKEIRKMKLLQLQCSLFARNEMKWMIRNKKQFQNSQITSFQPDKTRLRSSLEALQQNRRNNRIKNLEKSNI